MKHWVLAYFTTLQAIEEQIRKERYQVKEEIPMGNALLLQDHSS